MSLIYWPIVAGPVASSNVTIYDPYWADVTLLCHFDGANNSQSFVDSSSIGHTFDLTNASAAVCMTTAQQLFGTASLNCPGTSKWTQIGNPSTSFQFGSSDFTIECAIYTATPSQTADLLDMRAGTSSVVRPLIYIQSSVFNYFVNGVLRITGGTVATSTWQRLSVCRVSGNTRMFVNGTQVGSTYVDATNYSQGGCVFGASYNGASSLTGYIDEVRVTNGVGRYAANYTVASAAFPNG